MHGEVIVKYFEKLAGDRFYLSPVNADEVFMDLLREDYLADRSAAPA